MTSERVYYWRRLLKQYDPEVEYIKCVDSTVAGFISRLEYNPDKKTSLLEMYQCSYHVAMIFSHYMHKPDKDDMCQSYLGIHSPPREISPQVDK